MPFGFPSLFVPALYMLASLYLYSWFVRLLRPSPRVRLLIRVVFILLVIAFPLGRVLGREDYNLFTYALALFAALWMGFTFFFTLLAGGIDLTLFLVRRTSNGRFPVVQSLPFRRGVVLATSVLVLLIGGCALREARNIQTTRLDIPLRHLSAEMDGLSLVQLSDIHYGMIQENGRLAEIVRRINELAPDIVVITGDLVDEKISHMERMAEPLAALKARLGVFAVMGNHEYYAGVDRVEKILRGAGIRVLRNEIEDLPGGLQIVGIDDPLGRRRKGLPPPDFDGLVSRLDPGKPSILLFHQPINFEKAAKAGVGLELSGHTHGAQLLPMRPVSDLIFPHLRGLFRAGDSYLYVSRGVGTGGPPMRLGSPPELVYIRLKKA